MSKVVQQKVRFDDWLRDMRAAAPADEDAAARIEAVAGMIAETAELRDRLQHQGVELYRQILELAPKQPIEDGSPSPGDLEDPRQSRRTGEGLPSPKDLEDPRESSSIELVDADAGPCVECGQEVGRGLIGWSREPEDRGPLCDRCFGERNVDLAAAVAVIDCLRQIVADSQGPEAGPEAIGAAFNLARYYGDVTFGTWPLRPTGVSSLKEEVEDKMEERHGRYWRSELERRRGGWGEPS